MGLKLQFSGDGAGAYERALMATASEIKGAVEAAAAEAASMIRSKGRANIASAGFSSRWQEGFGVNVTASGSGEAGFEVVLQVFHRIGYAAVFEGGATIHGRPLLWLPIEANLPPPPGRQRWTPRRYARLVGPLASVQGRRLPLLFGRPPRRERAIPLFFGVPSVTIPDKFDLNEVIQEVMDDFESLYNKHLKAD
jgi:hypothetical protein